MQNYDLIIIGAGPAGLSLARELSRSDLKILLLDKKKNAEDVQYNTSGSFINPKEWGLPDDILNPINKIYFCSKNETAIKNGLAYIINRKKLLTFLEAESRKNKNLKIEYKSAIKEVNFGKQGINYLVYSKNEKDKKVSAKIFADCSGVGAVLGTKLKIAPLKPISAVGIEYLVPLKKEPKTADLLMGESLKGGYGWIFPKDSKTAIVGFGTMSQEYFFDIEKYLKEMWQIKRVSERCDLKPLEKNVAVLRTGKPLNKFTEKNLLIVGDSALQANPLAGEGIRFVMSSSMIASKWIKKSIKNNDLNLLKNYNKDWIKKYYKKYKIAFRLQQKLKKISADNNKLDFLVRKLKNISDKDSAKLLSGDLSYLFLTKIAMNLF